MQTTPLETVDVDVHRRLMATADAGRSADKRLIIVRGIQQHPKIQVIYA